MKQFVFVGLGKYSMSILEELNGSECEIMIIDKDEELVERYKNMVSVTFIADAINEHLIKELIKDTVDAAIIDVGKNIEVSILVCNYLKKIGVEKIVVKAESLQHGEILEIIGATDIIFPDQEAARRTAPSLLADNLYNYMPISSELVIAEVKLLDKYIGKSLKEIDLRNKFDLNVIGFRSSFEEEYRALHPDYKMTSDDLVLIAGKEELISKFIGRKIVSKNINTKKPSTKKNMFKFIKKL